MAAEYEKKYKPASGRQGLDGLDGHEELLDSIEAAKSTSRGRNRLSP